MKLTHDDLVDRARRWLISNPGLKWTSIDDDRRGQCIFVLTECGSFLTAEMPDAIGWHNGWTYLIECKVSRSDFLSDAKKPFRLKPETGMGNYRYYMVPDQSVATINDVPPNWGLLYYNGRKLEVIKRATKYDDKNILNENDLVIAVLRRLVFEPPIRGVSIKFNQQAMLKSIRDSQKGKEPKTSVTILDGR